MTNREQPYEGIPFLPSGPWAGFYTAVLGGYEYPQSLMLSFARGIIRGCGSDDVGKFKISGLYDSKNYMFKWEKSYESHQVFYLGCLRNDEILGLWTVSDCIGTFAIWPEK